MLVQTAHEHTWIRRKRHENFIENTRRRPYDDDTIECAPANNIPQHIFMSSTQIMHTC